MKFSQKVCDLKCVENIGNVHEFNGPVKIILVDPPEDQYERRTSGATFIAFANMMIGANVAIVLLFTLGFKLPTYTNAHVIMCTIGYQCCMPSAILMLHSLNGASAPLTRAQRRREHMITHFIGLFCGLFGSFLVYKYGDEPPVVPLLAETAARAYSAPHFGTGIATAPLSVVCIATGILMMLMNTDQATAGLLAAIHRFFGMLTFLLATICFILGIMKSSFFVWMYIIGYLSPAYLVLFFALFYTAVVLVSPASKFKRLPLSQVWRKPVQTN